MDGVGLESRFQGAKNNAVVPRSSAGCSRALHQGDKICHLMTNAGTWWGTFMPPPDPATCFTALNKKDKYIEILVLA
jgi:hypothetical protein